MRRPWPAASRARSCRCGTARRRRPHAGTPTRPPRRARRRRGPGRSRSVVSSRKFSGCAQRAQAGLHRSRPRGRGGRVRCAAMPGLTLAIPAATLLTNQSVIAMTTKTAAAPRQRRKEARPQELLDAALELFVEKGFAATRSEEVAARAGVAKGTLYLYYPSKEDLLKAVVRENLSALIAEAASIAGSFEGTTQELLVLLMQTWWA